MAPVQPTLQQRQVTLKKSHLTLQQRQGDLKDSHLTVLMKVDEKQHAGYAGWWRPPRRTTSLHILDMVLAPVVTFVLPDTKPPALVPGPVGPWKPPRDLHLCHSRHGRKCNTAYRGYEPLPLLMILAP